MLRRNKAPRRRGRRPRKAAFGLAQPFFHGIAGGERGRNPAFWALPVCAQLSYSFVRGAAVRLGVSAYHQPVFTPGEAPLRRVGDVGLSGPARSECRSVSERHVCMRARWKFPSPKCTIPDVTVERSYVGAKKALASDAATDDCVEVPNVLVMFVLLSHSGVGVFVVDAEPAMLPSAYPACCGGTKRPADAAEGREKRLSALRSHSFTVLPVAKGGGIPRFGPLPVYAQFSYGFVRGAAVRFRTPARLHTGRGSFWDALTTAWVYSVRRRASGRSFSKTGEWPVLFENGRVTGPFRKRASDRYFSNRQGCGSFGPTATEEAVCAARPHPRSSAGSSSNLLSFRSGMPAYGRIGRQLLPHGGSDVRHVFIRAGWAQPSGRGQILLLQGSVLAFRPKRGQLLLFAQK